MRMTYLPNRPARVGSATWYVGLAPRTPARANQPSKLPQASLTVWSLTLVSILTAAYTFTRSRSYRLFGADVYNTVDTPSAQRVRVQATPTDGSPLRLLAKVMTPETAESRAHPDKTRDVWELSIWDPLPLCLSFFCVFSPGHVLIYFMFLPLVPLDPKPSVTVFNCLILQVLLSAQLFALHSQYTQQITDQKIVNREVMNEYNAKYVYPRQHHTVRDVGTQFAKTKDGRRVEYVGVGTPTTRTVGQKFETHPNRYYSKHYDPDDYATRSLGAKENSGSMPSPPPMPIKYRDTRDETSTNPFAPRPKVRQSPTVRRSVPTGARPSLQSPLQTNAGSLGVYQHMESPLKKSTSLKDLDAPPSPRNSREMAALEQHRHERPRARHSSPSRGIHVDPASSRLLVKHPERYPSRW